MVNSLAYRNHEKQILEGNPPEKYVRLLPHIPEGRILEIGSAEGVLALMLARQGKHVIALERNEERHQTASRLYAEWLAREGKFQAPTFVNGDIRDNLDLLAKVDTLLAVRSIYYLRTDIDKVFAAVAQTVDNVVLCGNKNRAARWRQGIPDEPNGPFNIYAAREGMRALLKRHGYQIVTEVTEGDEIVVGRRIEHPLQNLAA